MDARAYYEGVISSVKDLIAKEHSNDWRLNHVITGSIESLGGEIAQEIADSELLHGENEFGNTGLMLAASWDFTQHVKYIPEKQPIHVMINRTLNEVIPKTIFANLFINSLAQSNHTINATNHEGDTALICAARAGNIQFVRRLLHANADPDLKNKKGETAEQVTHKFIIRKLLQSETLENKLANFQKMRALVAKQSVQAIKEDKKNCEASQTLEHATEHLQNLQSVSFQSLIANLDFILEHLHQIQDFSFLPSLITHFSSLLTIQVKIASDINSQTPTLAEHVAEEGSAIATYINAKYKKFDSQAKEERQPPTEKASVIAETTLLKTSTKLAVSVFNTFWRPVLFNNLENDIINYQEEDVLVYLDEIEHTPDLINPDGNSTPLMIAAFWGRLELVKLFLDLGANPFVKNKWDKIAEDSSHTEVRQLLHDIPKYMLSTLQKKRTEKCMSSNSEEEIGALVSLTIRSAMSDIDFILKRHGVNHALFPELIMRMANLFASLTDNDKRFEEYSHNLLKVAAQFGHDTAIHIVASYKDPKYEPKKDRVQSAKLKSLFKLCSSTDSDSLILGGQIDEDKCGDRIVKVKGTTLS